MLADFEKIAENKSVSWPPPWVSKIFCFALKLSMASKYKVREMKHNEMKCIYTISEHLYHLRAAEVGGYAHFIFVFAGSSLLCTGLSPAVASGGSSSPWWVGFSLQWLLLLWSTDSRAQVLQLWCTGLVASQHVGSSWIRDRAHVPCLGRQILIQWATQGSSWIGFLRLL